MVGRIGHFKHEISGLNCDDQSCLHVHVDDLSNIHLPMAIIIQLLKNSFHEGLKRIAVRTIMKR